MSSSDTSGKRPPAHLSPWAERFAQRRRVSHEPHVDVDAENARWTAEMIQALWTMFDAAVSEANTALEESGSSDRIDVQRTESDYRMSMRDPAGDDRTIAVFANMCVTRGHVTGGAEISTNWTRATIRLFPGADHGQMQWMVPTAEAELTPRVIADLFLSVFSDDPIATLRLSNYFTVKP